jgi:hypothetical protein
MDEIHRMAIHPSASKRRSRGSVRRPQDEFQDGDANKQQSDELNTASEKKTSVKWGKLAAFLLPDRKVLVCRLDPSNRRDA